MNKRIIITALLDLIFSNFNRKRAHMSQIVMKFLRELCHALNEIWLGLKLIVSPVGLIRNPLITGYY